MRTAVVFFGCIAIVFMLAAFVVGLVASSDALMSLQIALLTGFCTLTAAAMLGMRDTSRRRKALKRVRDRLSARSQLSDSSFCGNFDSNECTLALSARNALSKFYGVAEGSIYPDDDLWQDLEFAFFEPWVFSHVAVSVIPTLNDGMPFTFPATRPATFRDLVPELRRLERTLDEHDDWDN